MTAPHEITLVCPVELDGQRYSTLKVTDVSAIVEFKTHNAPSVVRSLAKVFNVPRKIIRRMEPVDTARAGEMIVAILNDSSRSLYR